MNGFPARPRSSLVGRSSNVQLIVSSTLRDPHILREHLIRHVFPELQRICRLRGIGFTEIDLRWWLAEQRSLDATVTQTCIDEIGVHRPFFIGIVGSDDGVDSSAMNGAPHCGPLAHDMAVERLRMIETEIMHDVLNNPLMKGRAFFYRYSHPRERDLLEGTSLGERLASLSARLVSAFPGQEPIDDPRIIGEQMRRDLHEGINLFHPLDDESTPVEQERRAHQSFAESYCRSYIEVGDYLARLDEHARGSAQPLIVTGESGAGKSALLAYWTARYRRDNPDAFVIEHYIGAVSSVADHVPLLRRIMAEIRERYGLADEIPATGIEEKFPFWLGHVQRERLVLVIDALNQLDERSHDMSWLPDYFPPNIRLIVSTLEGAALDALRDREWPEALPDELEVRPLSRSQSRDVIGRFLDERGTKLTEGQLRRVSDNPNSANFLFLLTGLKEMHAFGGYEQLNEKIEYYLDAADHDDLFQRVLGRLEAGRRKLVEDVMTLIWCARFGMSETELREITGASQQKLVDLLQAAEHRLMRREGLLIFSHDYFRQAVARRYFDNGTRLTRRDVHLCIARHFAARPMSRRRLDEYLWQLERAGAWDELAGAFVDLRLFEDPFTDERSHELLRFWRSLADRVDLTGRFRNRARALIMDADDAVASARTVGNLAGFLHTAGSFDLAEELYHAAIDRCERVVGRRDLTVATLRENLATVLYSRGKVEAAKDLLLGALELRREVSPHDDEQIAGSLTSLGAMEFAVRAYDRAREHFLSALDILDRRGIRHDRRVAEIQNNLGAVMRAEGDHRAALDAFKRAYEINREALGEEHPDLALNLTNIGLVQSELGQFEEARASHSEALAIHEKALGFRHPLRAIYLSNLGLIHRELEDIESAEQCLTAALHVRRSALGRDNLDTAISMARLASLFKAKADYERAEPLYLESLDVTRSLLGAEHGTVRYIESGLEDMRGRSRD